MENFGGELLKVIIYLSLVIGLMYLISYFLKKSISGKSKGKYIQVIEQIYIAPRKSLILLQVQEQIFLLSNTETDLKVISTWNEEDFPELGIPEREESFKSYFSKLTRDNRRDRDEKK